MTDKPITEIERGQGQVWTDGLGAMATELVVRSNGSRTLVTEDGKTIFLTRTGKQSGAKRFWHLSTREEVLVARREHALKLALADEANRQRAEEFAVKLTQAKSVLGTGDLSILNGDLSIYRWTGQTRYGTTEILYAFQEIDGTFFLDITTMYRDERDYAIVARTSCHGHEICQILAEYLAAWAL